VVLTVQDWGGLLGLTLPMDIPERYTGLFIMNTAFATGVAPLPRGLLDWRASNNGCAEVWHSSCLANYSQN
jgi:tRNA(adenine34) deaminase